MKTHQVKFRCTAQTFRPCQSSTVRWLDWDTDFVLAKSMWPAEFPLTREIWDEARTSGYRYCAIVKDNHIFAIAAVWRYSEKAWEVAAVKTALEFRNMGYGKAVVSFITAQILAAGRLATCTTNSDNVAMIRTAESVGFQRIAQ